MPESNSPERRVTGTEFSYLVQPGTKRSARKPEPELNSQDSLSSNAVRESELENQEFRSGDAPLNSPPEPVPQDFSPRGGELDRGYRDVADNSNATGLRIVARIIDLTVVNFIANLVTLPIFLNWFFSTVDKIEKSTDESEYVYPPWDIFQDFLVTWSILIAVMLIIQVLYFFVLEHMYQQTAGKKAFGLKVFSESGGRASARQLLARSILYTFSVLLYFWIIEVIVMIVSQNHRTVTDRITGTRVIRFRRVYN